MIRVGVIGGGAAGLMAATVLVESLHPGGIELHVFEKNDHVGAKVLISGGGRCNVTTGFTEVRDVLRKYPRGASFLKYALYEFGPKAMYTWVEEHNVGLKTEDDMRVFPNSNNGADVVGIFERILHRYKAEIHLNASVKMITKEECFAIELHSGEIYECDYVVITTGGQAYRHTGSTGDGYAFAESLGHTTTNLAPSLHSFVVSEDWIADLAGVSYDEVKFSAISTQQVYTYTGPMMFTHKGVTGPCVFAVSSQCAFEPFSKEQPLTLAIDLVPKRNEDELVDDIFELITHNPQKSFKNILDILLPRRLAELCMKIFSWDTAKVASTVSKKDVRQVAMFLKKMTLHAVRKGVGDEFVTAGGVRLSEVSDQTMESLITPGLYFAGEVLDIDGYTGGYNLQSAWSTGYIAARSIAAKIEAVA